ncbi:MAG TPA: hypothetical protein VL742_14480 [Casimicrobiaceae bacterium]|nr:hypothetical protein [Casimicrobiaceae bacterium]
MADAGPSAGEGRIEDLHEGTRLDGRRVVGFALAVVGLIAVALAVALAVHELLRHRPEVTPGARLQPASSVPRLQSNGVEDLKAFNAEKAKLLHSYAWIDRDAGVVRIPIERAMSLLAQRAEPPSTAATQAGQ